MRQSVLVFVKKIARLFKNLKHVDTVFYIHFFSHMFYSILSKFFFETAASARLGAGPEDATHIKSHAFFRQVNWEQAMRRGMEPPFTPVIKNEEDTSQFDSKFTQMTPLDSPVDSILSESANQGRFHLPRGHSRSMNKKKHVLFES